MACILLTDKISDFLCFNNQSINQTIRINTNPIFQILKEVDVFVFSNETN